MKLLEDASMKHLGMLLRSISFLLPACGKGKAFKDAPPAGRKAKALLAAQRAVCLMQSISHHSMEDREQSSLWTGLWN